MSITIRRATIEDAAILAKLSAETFYDAFGDKVDADDMKEFLTIRNNISLMEEELLDSYNEFYLAEAEKQDAGYLMLSTKQQLEYFDGKQALEIKRIYARKAYWGGRIGKLLMEKALELGQTGNFDVIWLQVWDENIRAIEFYKKWGFEMTELRLPFVTGKRVDWDPVMVKRIAPIAG